MVILSELFTKRPAIFSAAMLLVATVSLMLLPQSASAASICGVQSGNYNSYAGALIEVRYLDYETGTYIDTASPHVRVTTYRAATSGGNIVRVDTATNTITTDRENTLDFYQTGICGGSKVVLGYNGTSSAVGKSAGGNWALDCDYSKLAPNFQTFDFTGVGVPAGARAGGTWNTVRADPPNGFTTSLTVTYTEPPPDLCPNITGSQITIPAGMFKDGSGNCVPDVCPNITGGQATIPAGMFKDGSGNCVPDVCPNITGGQATVPVGYIKDASGNCVRPFALSATLTGPTTTNDAGVKYLEPGGTYTFGPGALNTSANSSYAYTLSLNNPNAAIFTVGPPSSWSEGVLGTPASRTRSTAVTVSASAASGSGPFCFRSNVTPAQNNGTGVNSPDLCYMVYKVYQPAVIGRGSDIHAGSGVCSASYAIPGSGFVKGQGDSKGEYVVSARTSVVPFGSNGSSASSSASIGTYLPQTLCRPDLDKVASTFVSTHIANSAYVLKAPIGPYSLYQLNVADIPLNTGIIYFNGDVTISGGTVIRKLTIYSTGTITITGNIALGDSNVARNMQPSLGLIARNGINIIGPVTQVDAYMFSNGTINTCSSGSCNTTLGVRGFLMSKILQLRRLGPLN